ncbi:hypothetical protein [Psychroserpens sp. SPM9]|uniref:hypothetical protein n=1 Tax=Psychroserpens sp. SPM9 TaxID=2975598 RepID=UPI0021A40145|nr:hypothetical protein [Psychroserpens sp. SPM9]MDG5490541.1 hypothetical protein [Psychroserpens sp. SPM9]
MKFYNQYRLYFILFLLLGCSKPDVAPSSTYNDNDNETGGGSNNSNPSGLTIDNELRPFYDSFIEAMQERGQNLGDLPISIEFVNQISAPNSSQFCAYGYPNFNNTGAARVEVINSFGCWDRWTSIQKENLMYHEFGHALLSRGHMAGYLPNGSERSLMCSSSDCNNYRVYTVYQEVQRDYYLDELLNIGIAIPDWAVEKNYTATLLEDSFSDIQDWEFETETVNGESSTNPYTFFIEDTEYFSPPFALGIASESNSETATYGHWYKDYTIDNSNDCSNLIVKTDLKYNGLNEGLFAVIVDLYDTVDTDLEFAQYYTILDTNSSTTVFENFETNVICIPNETTKFRVRFYLETQSASTVYIDNLEVDLYE